MLEHIPEGAKIYIACGYTDLRKQIDGLAAMVKESFQLDPFQDAFFLFCGRKRDRMKALYWEGDGFLLLYKRLEGGTYQWPRSAKEVQELTPQQYRWLLEGLTIEQKSAISKVSAGMTTNKSGTPGYKNRTHLSLSFSRKRA